MKALEGEVGASYLVRAAYRGAKVVGHVPVVKNRSNFSGSQQQSSGLLGYHLTTSAYNSVKVTLPCILRSQSADLIFRPGIHASA
jgi:hypothetical protein